MSANTFVAGDSTYALLEGVQVILGEGIGLGNDGDEVDTGAQTLHDLNIEGLKTAHPNPRQQPPFARTPRAAQTTLTYGPSGG